MVLYAESSAVLAWLFGEEGSMEVVAALEGASLVVTSEITNIECARAIHRARALDLVTDVQARALHSDYRSAASQWDVLPVGDRVVHVAAAPWPVEPVRALDAIHLASALLAHEAWPDLRLLTRDKRVEANAEALRLPLARAGGEAKGSPRRERRPPR